MAVSTMMGAGHRMAMARGARENAMGPSMAPRSGLGAVSPVDFHGLVEGPYPARALVPGYSPLGGIGVFWV